MISAIDIIVSKEVKVTEWPCKYPQYMVYHQLLNLLLDGVSFIIIRLLNHDGHLFLEILVLLGKALFTVGYLAQS